LQAIARESERGFELVFFRRLREEVRRHLGAAPAVLKFSGLRPCVKILTGVKRWCPRCQTLQDQIVSFLRECFGAEPGGRSCALLVK
jgi:hypothetical protein